MFQCRGVQLNAPTRKCMMKFLHNMLILLSVLLMVQSLGILTVAAAPAPAHDPVIMKESDQFYLFTTGQGISISRSSDLVNWQYARRVFNKAPDWTFKEIPEFKGVLWAPDIAFVNGHYFLYYSVSTFGSNLSCIGLAVNETLNPQDPRYKWDDLGIVIQSTPADDFNAIDPNFIQTDDGRAWLSFGSFWTGIKLVELDSATGKPLSNPPDLIALASRPGVEYNPIEAPFIFKHGDYYYLFVSWDFCCQKVKSTYNIRVGRAKEIAGTYFDKDGKSMLEGGGTLVLEGAGDMHGPGHNAVIRNGKQDLLVHHMYDGTRGGMAVLQIRPIYWDADGWPIVGDPLGK
ncbi:glycoside hydrolase family 43 [Candidatus Moduliflexus flocculans]|uniref:Glycoside hydrolase family 43 n=1 Tax=Candidatus Moduliflexus flocculans TaxID=1499966 RepID=A0A081BS77_9BACT|nr:glycoside hydrolase family 43 [Candidatus Moduliflexus flocculans]